MTLPRLELLACLISARLLIFAVTGLDHAGPLNCCDTPQKKYWVLLFTCGVVRAVHFELVDALSTYDTVLAFQRLVAHRGLPKVIYSDNAKGFVAAPDMILGQFGPLTPEWLFIAPNSPWWGGWWERLVRSVKSALRKNSGRELFDRNWVGDNSPWNWSLHQ